MMRNKRSGQYKEHILKLKHDDTKTRKCGCPYKMHKYHKENNTWAFNMTCSLHNYGLSGKLASHPIFHRQGSE